MYSFAEDAREAHKALKSCTLINIIPSTPMDVFKGEKAVRSYTMGDEAGALYNGMCTAVGTGRLCDVKL
jgi:hypothetical protein